MVTKNSTVLFVFFTIICIMTTTVNEWLLFRILFWGSYCRFNTHYDHYNKRRKSSHSQQKQSHELKSHFKFPWHTLKVFNIACMKFWERLKFSNLWVDFASHHNRRVLCVLNFVREKRFLFFFLIFQKALFLQQY